MSTTTTELNLETILYAKKGAIAYVTLNRPKVLNALNRRTWEDLKAAFEDAQDDAAVRGVILTGAGDKAFIAGADISELAQIKAVEAEKSSTFGQDVLNLIENLGKPVIAAVNGFALGGGCETAMACTIRIAAENAKFGQPEIKLGLIPGGGGTQRLPRLVGIGRAMLLNLTGDFIDAPTASDWGLVERVVPRDELRDAALGIARTIAARSPVSVGILRELARTTRDLPLEEGLRREADGFRRCLESEDGAEGVAAFLEKREPKFVGR